MKMEEETSCAPISEGICLNDNVGSVPSYGTTINEKNVNNKICNCYTNISFFNIGDVCCCGEFIFRFNIYNKKDGIWVKLAHHLNRIQDQQKSNIKRKHFLNS